MSYTIILSGWRYILFHLNPYQRMLVILLYQNDIKYNIYNFYQNPLIFRLYIPRRPWWWREQWALTQLLSDDVGHDAIVTTQVHDPAAIVCVNSTYIKHSISWKRSLDRPQTSTVLEHSYYFTDVLHVNFKIWGLNLNCIDLHGKLKIAMTSCPTTSVSEWEKADVQADVRKRYFTQKSYLSEWDKEQRLSLRCHHSIFHSALLWAHCPPVTWTPVWFKVKADHYCGWQIVFLTCWKWVCGSWSQWPHKCSCSSSCLRHSSFFDSEK